jgi:hypothetical protein
MADFGRKLQSRTTFANEDFRQNRTFRVQSHRRMPLGCYSVTRAIMSGREDRRRYFELRTFGRARHNGRG